MPGAGQLRGNGFGPAIFGMTEADAVALLEDDNGTWLRAEPPTNTATPPANGCAATGDAIVGFESGLIIGISAGAFSSWSIAGEFDGVVRRTPAGLGWGDTFDEAKRLYRDKYHSADLMPLYNWGGSMRIVATIEESGSVVLAAREALDAPEAAGNILLLTAGEGCVPPPITPPTGDKPIGERFTINVENDSTGYPQRIINVDGEPNGWLTRTDQCYGVAVCDFMVSANDEPDRTQQVWIGLHVDRERADAVWLITDVISAETPGFVFRPGYCQGMDSGNAVKFVAIGVAANGTSMSVLTIDTITASFVLVDLAIGMSCQTQWDEGGMLPISPDRPAPPPLG